MAGVEILQPGGLGSFNAAGLASPGTPHVVSRCRVYFRLVSSTSSYASSSLTKPTGSTASITNRLIRGLGFSYGFSPDVEDGNYTISITDNLSAVHSITVYCRLSDVPAAFAVRATAVNVAWFGGMPNANFFSTSNGKWYQDAGLTLEATDDAPKFVAAVAYAAAIGGADSDVHGSVYIPAGNWYFPNSPTGPNGEFVHTPSGVSVFGDGDASCIRIGPGLMSGTGGYATVFGTNDQTASGKRYDYRFQKFRIDHNSKFNQMANAGGAGLAYPYACSVMVPRGKRIRVEDVTSVNHAGRFNILVGEYGFLSDTDNAIISRCQCLHEADDPKVGDTSIIVCTANNSQVTDNIVDAGRAESVALPKGNIIVTAFEVHSTNGTVTNNVARSTARFLNFGGDSADQATFLVQGNLADDVVSGITIYPWNLHTINGLSILDNIIKVRQGTAAFGEAGISVADWSANAPNVDGSGIINARITGNQIIFTYTITTDPVTGLPVTPGPTPSHSYGMNMLGIANRVEIGNNIIVGFATAGILWNATSKNANAGNLNQDMYIHDNLIYRPGSYGIFLGGKVGEASPVLIRTRIERNRIIDDRGGGSALSYGIYVNGYPDSSFRRWWNEVVGAATADYFLDTGTYPTSATLPETTSGDFKVSGNETVTGSLRVGGTTAAQQSLHVTGAGLLTSEFMQNGDNSGAAFSWASNAYTLFRDSGAMKSTSGATTFFTWGSGGLTPTANLLDIPYAIFTKKTDPGAPSADHGTLYMKDNGAGKMQLVIRFPTGAVQVIATEP